MPLVIFLGYLIGSVPFALFFARQFGGADLRHLGSGNLGAANVLRTSGVKAGILVAALDIAKGVASVLLAIRLSPDAAAPAAAVLPAVMVFVLTVWATRYVSLGSVLASLVLPATAYATGSPRPAVIVACAAAALILFRHHSNFMRWLAGTERRLGGREASAALARATVRVSGAATLSQTP